MNESNLSSIQVHYLRRVERLLADLQSDDRMSLLADLQDQFDEIGESDLVDRLGTPEGFVEEYRRSAGIEGGPDPSADSRSISIASVVSALALPLGVLVLFSFGGQMILGPFVVVAEWFLARISPRPLRIAWSVLAGALVGEIVVIMIGAYLFSIDRAVLVTLWALIAAPIAVFVYRTSSARPS